jgi:hypothetical protein
MQKMKRYHLRPGKNSSRAQRAGVKPTFVKRKSVNTGGSETGND